MDPYGNWWTIAQNWKRMARHYCIPRMKGNGDTSVFHITLLTHKKKQRKDVRRKQTNKKLIRN